VPSYRAAARFVVGATVVFFFMLSLMYTPASQTAHAPIAIVENQRP